MEPVVTEEPEEKQDSEETKPAEETTKPEEGGKERGKGDGLSHRQVRNPQYQSAAKQDESDNRQKRKEGN